MRATKARARPPACAWMAAGWWCRETPPMQSPSSSKVRRGAVPAGLAVTVGWRLHGGAIPSRFDDAACCHMTSMLCTALATAHSVPDATCSAPGPCSRRAAHVSGLLGQHDLVAGGCRMLLASTPHARMYSRREDPTHITPPAPCPCRSQAAPFVAACNGSVGACSPACAEQLAPFNQRCFHSVLSEQFFQFGPAAQPPSVEAVHAFYSTCFPATGGPAAGGVASGLQRRR